MDRPGDGAARAERRLRRTAALHHIAGFTVAFCYAVDSVLMMVPSERSTEGGAAAAAAQVLLTDQRSLRLLFHGVLVVGLTLALPATRSRFWVYLCSAYYPITGLAAAGMAASALGRKWVGWALWCSCQAAAAAAALVCAHAHGGVLQVRARRAAEPGEVLMRLRYEPLPRAVGRGAALQALPAHVAALFGGGVRAANAVTFPGEVVELHAVIDGGAGAVQRLVGASPPPPGWSASRWRRIADPGLLRQHGWELLQVADASRALIPWWDCGALVLFCCMLTEIAWALGLSLSIVISQVKGAIWASGAENSGGVADWVAALGASYAAAGHEAVGPAVGMWGVREHVPSALLAYLLLAGTRALTGLSSAVASCTHYQEDAEVGGVYECYLAPPAIVLHFAGAAAAAALLCRRRRSPLAGGQQGGPLSVPWPAADSGAAAEHGADGAARGGAGLPLAGMRRGTLVQFGCWQAGIAAALLLRWRSGGLRLTAEAIDGAAHGAVVAGLQLHAAERLGSADPAADGVSVEGRLRFLAHLLLALALQSFGAVLAGLYRMWTPGATADAAAAGAVLLAAGARGVSVLAVAAPVWRAVGAEEVLASDPAPVRLLRGALRTLGRVCRCCEPAACCAAGTPPAVWSPLPPDPDPDAVAQRQRAVYAQGRRAAAAVCAAAGIVCATAVVVPWVDPPPRWWDQPQPPALPFSTGEMLVFHFCFLYAVHALIGVLFHRRLSLVFVRIGSPAVAALAALAGATAMARAATSSGWPRGASVLEGGLLMPLVVVAVLAAWRPALAVESACLRAPQDFPHRTDLYRPPPPEGCS
eukprot:TRINITY_DN20852_c0_g1_i1.p1 TRINITY_DN20852_c0_g1~~TRINITY_DN20852_c0_g1_i1.p1  ORF type:complete len:839 (+),score=136.94 TRINITY_DN20852_c0_g1_i1:72-2519(+)